MSRIHQLISELKEIGREPGHRSALQIHRILDGNRKLFLEKIEGDNFGPIVNNFEALAGTSAREYNSSFFKDDYTRNFDLLMFYCNRV